MWFIVIVSILILLCAGRINGYASYFASEDYCGVTLAVGETLMGSTVQSGNSRSIVVKRSGVALANGDYYVAGESLKVSLSSSALEWAFQVSSGSATFTNGACSKTRIGDITSATLVMPSSGAVTINGGSAQSEGTVLMFADFTLNCCLSPTSAPVVKPTVTPTALPSEVPTESPTTVIPSTSPTNVPTVLPTVNPTPEPTVKPTTARPTTHSPTAAFTEPTYNPTFVPSALPSVLPSVKPSQQPSVIPSLQPSLLPTVRPSFTVTGRPSALPTLEPTFVVQTQVTYQVSQTVNNITAAQFTSDVNSAFADTMKASLQFFSPPQHVRIVSVTDESRRRLTSESGIDSDEAAASTGRQLTTRSVNIVYGVDYVLQATTFSDAEDLSTALTSAVDLISNSPLFVYTLQSQGVSAVSGVQSTSSSGVSSPVITAVNTGAPSLKPVASPSTPHDDDDIATIHDDKLNSGPISSKVATGVVVGIIGVALVYYVTNKYLNNYESLLKLGDHFTSYPSFLAIVCAVISIILVSAWATDNNPQSRDQLYLGAPSWSTNVFAWHPVLMVAGLYAAQVKAINDWNLFSDHGNGKLSHVLFQTAALSCTIAAMCAVVKFNFERRTPALNTMHSWMGAAAVAMFCCNYLLGMSSNVWL